MRTSSTPAIPSTPSIASIAFIAAFTVCCVPLGAQQTVIPDIPGFKTLQCDFHMHTTFSDGSVFPTVRVDEAAREGLSAFAITDHSERRRNVENPSISRNRPHELAAPAAKAKNIVLIRGTEITREMPPGHLNAIFIKDADAIYNKNDWRASLAEAKKQGAFITWNHPGWNNQQPHITRWFPEHDEIHKNGMMHGIEVANGGVYFPEAFQWALDKKLTMLGCSDVHTPQPPSYDIAKGEHRCMTLVFAKEHTAAAIRDALNNRRTAVYCGALLLGEERWLRPLLEKSLVVKSITYLKAAPGSSQGNRIAITLKNNSSLTFHLKKIVPGVKPVYLREYVVKPHGQTTVNVGHPDETGTHEVLFHITNLLITPETPLPHTITTPPNLTPTTP